MPTPNFVGDYVLYVMIAIEMAFHTDAIRYNEFFREPDGWSLLDASRGEESPGSIEHDGG
jgi:hypothetical protein